MKLRLWCIGVMLGALLFGPASAQPTRVEQILAGMSLSDKVAQMFMANLYGAPLNAPGRELLTTWKPGSAVLFASNVGDPVATTRLINEWQAAVVGAGGVPMFITTDQEGGVIARLKDGFTTLPAMMLLTATGDVSLARRTGETLARELSAVGVNLNLAPVADLYTNLRNPVIGRRSFGSEPERTGQMLAALIRGMQGGGVLATAKHFPGHGDTELDSHTSLPTVDYARDELSRVELAPFRWTIAAGVEAVMVAHIWYPAYDPDERLPASLSYNVVTGLLREELGFTGLIMTDAIEMDAIDLVYSYPEASIRAIEAGVDIVAFGANLSPSSQIAAMSGVVEAVRSGRLSEARIDESVRRILDAKQRYGVLDWQPLDPAGAPARVDAAQGAALVRELFNAGVTVAYDQTGALPLDPARTRVSVIYPASRPAIRQSCEAASGGGVTWLGVGESPSQDDIARAVSVAGSSERAVVFTSNAAGNPAQQALVKALPADKTVAVALFSPFDWMAFPAVSAYVTTYSPLPEAVPAACGVLFGQLEARGSLPVSLAGVRDFDNGGAQLTDGSALSLLPRSVPAQTATLSAPDETLVAVLLTPASSLPPPATLTPVPPTATFAPLDSTRRAPPTLPAPSQTPPPTDEPTAIALIIPPTAAPPDAPPVIPSDDGETGRIVLISALLTLGAGLMLVAVLGRRATLRHAPVRARSAQPAAAPTRPPAEAARPRPERLPVQRCPVCRQVALRVERGGKLLHCSHCYSVIRRRRDGRWVIGVTPAAEYRAVYDRWNERDFSEAELRSL
jgi:beta-N-acetylhexosaminidase